VQNNTMLNEDLLDNGANVEQGMKRLGILWGNAV